MIDTRARAGSYINNALLRKTKPLGVMFCWAQCYLPSCGFNIIL